MTDSEDCKRKFQLNEVHPPITGHAFIESRPLIAPVINLDDVVKPYFDGFYDSAQNIKLQRLIKLPWQSDTEGRLYSTPSDLLKAKINMLRAILGLNKYVHSFSNELPEAW